MLGPASIPSPSRGIIEVGPLTIRAYGLCIAVGVISAVVWSGRRWVARGGRIEDITAVAKWGVPAGIVGARLYHVITDWRRFRGRWGDVPKIWQGGLGIWGGIALGVLVGLWVGRRRNMALGPLLDTVAPVIPLAQALGRLGNWFNQELFGRPTTLPWALEIDPRKRPAGYSRFETFHPTFLYEMLWNLSVVGLVLLSERRFSERLKPGRLFALYVALYTFGRFWIERLRIDAASRVGGVRINEYVSAIVFGGAVLFLVRGLRPPKAEGTVEGGQTDGAAVG